MAGNDYKSRSDLRGPRSRQPKMPMKASYTLNQPMNRAMSHKSAGVRQRSSNKNSQSLTRGAGLNSRMLPLMVDNSQFNTVNESLNIS